MGSHSFCPCASLRLLASSSCFFEKSKSPPFFIEVASFHEGVAPNSSLSYWSRSLSLSFPCFFIILRICLCSLNSVPFDWSCNFHILLYILLPLPTEMFSAHLLLLCISSCDSLLFFLTICIRHLILLLLSSETLQPLSLLAGKQWNQFSSEERDGKLSCNRLEYRESILLQLQFMIGTLAYVWLCVVG